MRHNLRKELIRLVTAVAAVVPAFGSTVTADMQTAVSTGFTLVGDNISNTGTSAITGSVGVGSSAGTITGFYPTGTSSLGTSGIVAPGSSTSNAAFTDFLTAYNAALALTGGTAVTAGLPTEAFTATSAVTVFTLPTGGTSTATGTHLTFNANGFTNAVFIIQVPGPFTVNGAMTFTLNGVNADNIIWVVGTAATISVGSSGAITFDGNILAGTTFTMSAASGGSGTLAGTIDGCVFSDTGTNTLAGTTNVEGCSAYSGNASSGAVPEPGTTGLFAVSLLSLGLLRRRFQN